MSALPDRPSHFTEWLERRGLPAEGFVPRVTYGEYLSELLEETRAAAPDGLQIVQGDAVRAEVTPGGIAVRLDDGREIRADALVLALGNLPPAPPDNLDPATLPSGSYEADPWSATIADGLTDNDRVLIVGTGLTMVDAALLLTKKGFRGDIVALSRRGLAPRAHGTGHAIPTSLSERPAIETSALVREVRLRSEAIGWRAAVDELRPYTQSMWLAASADQRARFLRHVRPWWEVHRHRSRRRWRRRWTSSPVRAGCASLAAGRSASPPPTMIASASAGAPGAQRGGRSPRPPRHQLQRARVDLDRTDRSAGAPAAPRWTHHRRRIAARPVRRSPGASDRRRWPGQRAAVRARPLTRGTFWEITAVPDIRMQTWSLARRLANAHWVAGEGL